MAVTVEDVRHVAALARLEFSDEELAGLAEEMSEMLEYCERLGGLDTDGVGPLFRTRAQGNVLRDDEPEAPLGVDEALANAPDREGDYFLVPGFLPQD